MSRHKHKSVYIELVNYRLYKAGLGSKSEKNIRGRLLDKKSAMNSTNIGEHR